MTFPYPISKHMNNPAVSGTLKYDNSQIDPPTRTAASDWPHFFVGLVWTRFKDH